MDFKSRLKSCRNKNGWTQEEISKLLEIKRPRYAKYETGENQPDYSILIKLADLFGVSTDYLLGRNSSNSDENFKKNINHLIALNDYLKSLNINSHIMFNIERWRYLNRKDIAEIKSHIEWTVYKAQKRICE